jgi:hypothetical protein
MEKKKKRKKEKSDKEDIDVYVYCFGTVSVYMPLVPCFALLLLILR